VPEASAPGELPTDEQDVLDTIKREFGATEPPPPNEPAAESEASSITENQRKKMLALFREKGIEGRDDRLRYSSAIIGREVTTSADLTFDEASQIIDQLSRDDSDFYPWTDFQP
jgi:hypothetical protein